MPGVIDLEQAQAGDLVFCHSKGIIGRAIRLGEWIRWRGGSAHNHVAVLDTKQLDGWTVIQAEARGVTAGSKLATIAPGGSYVIVQAPEGVDRDKVLAFARGQVGDCYGYVAIASVIVTILTPWFVNVTLPFTWICSAVSAESLRAGGWIHRWGSVESVTPAQLWEALVGTPAGK